jgi:hypothetical protein
MRWHNPEEHGIQLSYDEPGAPSRAIPYYMTISYDKRCASCKGIGEGFCCAGWVKQIGIKQTLRGGVEKMLRYNTTRAHPTVMLQINDLDASLGRYV